MGSSRERFVSVFRKAVYIYNVFVLWNQYFVVLFKFFFILKFKKTFNGFM